MKRLFTRLYLWWNRYCPKHDDFACIECWREEKARIRAVARKAGLIKGGSDGL